MQPSKTTRPAPASHTRAGTTPWETSDFENGLIIAHNAYTRWMSRCMAAAGNADLTPLETLVLQNVNHRGREKRLGDICFLLNIEDSHTVNYALRKLLKSGLLDTEKRGKEVFYTASANGASLCDAYRSIRKECLLDVMPQGGASGEEMRKFAAALRTMSGHFDQASRAAASL